MTSINKLYIFLAGAIFIAASAFTWTIFKAREITVTPDSKPLVSEGYYEISTNEDPILGNPGAPLTIVIFSDFVCGDCQQKYTVITNFVKSNPQTARLFLKYSPKPSLFLKANDLAYRGAVCANKQNNFWEFNDLLINTRNPNNKTELENNITSLKLNNEAWQNCLSDQSTQQKIAGSVALSQTLGITEIPAIYVNNKRLNLDTNPDISELLSKLIAK